MNPAPKKGRGGAISPTNSATAVRGLMRQRVGSDEMAFVMRNWARLASKPGKSKAYVYYFTLQRPLASSGKEGGAIAPGPHESATHVSEIL